MFNSYSWRWQVKSNQSNSWTLGQITPFSVKSPYKLKNLECPRASHNNGRWGNPILKYLDLRCFPVTKSQSDFKTLGIGFINLKSWEISYVEGILFSWHIIFQIKHLYLIHYVSPPLWGRHIVFALSVCPSVRLSVSPSVTLRFRSITWVPYDPEPSYFIGW